MTPAKSTPFGFTRVIRRPAMGMEIIAMRPPGPRTHPARNAV
ncbi:MAG: hypothetical protein BWX71_02833 [Deltaproteobacteria bacterium ADurb.Bin072]|nr:MAG: hypothetical protein BWX71_02833 [Deltaproteobacteria bacterium ADurb.Bin072]